MELEKMNAMQPMRARVKITRPAVTHGEVRCALLLYSPLKSAQSLDALLDVGQLILALGVLIADVFHEGRRGT